MLRRVTLISILSILAVLPTASQERFSFFQASTPESVERMLRLAELRDDDVVVDLGSGNGLIPLTAARMNRRLRGYGVDINPKLVEESNQQAKSEGLGDRVKFEFVNAFDADLSNATVVTMWLFPELMRLLRPVILERARPGTRVLTSTWDLGTWQPDKTDSDGTAIYMWIVPARVAGGWHWDLDVAGRRTRYAAALEQRFQMIEGAARAGDRREVLEGATLEGGDIAFTLKITLDGLGLTQHEFSGKVDGNQIAGTVKVTPAEQQTMTLPWRAQRVERSDYFAPTGIEMFKQPAAAAPLAASPAPGR
jgi:SAM-dependent methyltransferase